MEECVKFLVQGGKSKIAFVMESDSPAAHNKLRGYESGLKLYGAESEGIYRVQETSWKAGYEITVQILEERPEVQGIIYCVDLLAAGGLRAAYDREYSVPQRLGIIGVDNSTYGEITMPRLTTLDNKLQELSEVAATLLRMGLEGTMQNKKLMVFSEIIEREST